jgi:hypothetical protein
MALSDPEFEKLAEILEKVNARFGGLESAIKLSMESNNLATRNQKTSQENYKRLMREREKSEREIIESQRKGNLTAREAQVELNKLNAKIRDAVPAEFKESFENFVYNQEIANKLQLFGNSLLVKYNKQLEIGTQILGSLGGAAVKIFNAYRGGQTDIEMAGTTFAAASGAFLGTTSAVGKGSAGLMAVSPLLIETGIGAAAAAGLGIGLQLLGNFVDGASNKINELAQKAIPILTSEVNKLYTSFNAISSTGAIFADGIKGMNQAALNARLSLPEFSDVLRESSGNLAQLGISTTEAAKRMGGVGLALRANGTDKQLAALGYTAKEQASLIAETMAQMRQSGGALTVSNEEVAQQTAKYAENLRIVSAITGEDAKKKEQQVRDQSNEVAFQQKLAGLDATQRQNVIAAMENMSDAQRKAFMETVVFGQAITPASAYMVNNIQGFGDSVNRAAQEFEAGTLDGASMRRTNAEFGEAIKADILASRDLARAGFAGIGGIVADLNKSLKDELIERNRVTADAIAAAEENVRKNVNETEDLTKSMVKAAYAGRDMANAIQKAILDKRVLETFATTIADTTSAIVDVIHRFTRQANGVGVVTQADQQLADQENRRLRARLGAAGAIRSAEITETQQANDGLLLQYLDAAGTRLAAQGLIPGNQAGNMDAIRAYLRDHRDDPEYSRIPESLRSGLAIGGIVSGSRSGYLAKLHGTEAVLPENLTNMLLETARQNQTLSENLPQAINRPNKSEELLSMLNSKFDDMLDVMSDISNYTERTSVRIA